MSETFYFLGAKEIGAECLKTLLAYCQQRSSNVVGVFTNPRGEEVRSIAAAHSIPVHDNLESLITLPKATFLISVQYHKILRKRHLERAERFAVNLHMAPLPEYRGCNQFSFAIANGDREFGATLHVMDEGVDSGDILAERRFEISDSISVDQLYRATYEHSVEMFGAELPGIVDGTVKPTPQKDFEGKRRVSFHLRSEIEDLKRIDLRWPEEKILRTLRATSMPGFPPPYALLNGTKVELRIAETE